MRRLLPLTLLVLLVLSLFSAQPVRAVTSKLHWYGDEVDDFYGGVLSAPWTSNFAIAENGDILTAETQYTNLLRIHRYNNAFSWAPWPIWPGNGWVDLIPGGGTPSTFPNIPGNARIVDDGEGGVIVSYKALNSGPPMMYVQRILADGSKAWGANGLMIGPNDFDYENGGSLFSDGAGGAYVMWHAYNRIQVQKIESDGSKAWGPEGTIISDSGTYLENTPEFIQVGETDFIVAWVDTSLDVVLAQKINGDGDIQWADGGVEVVEINDAIDVEITMVPDNLGGAYITTNQGKIARVAANGSLPWGSSQIDYDIEYVLGSLSSTDDLYGAHGKNNKVIADSAGNAYIYGTDGSGRLAIQKISSAGSNVWSPSVKSYPSAPNVAVTINGDFNSDSRFTLFWNRSSDNRQLAQMFTTDGVEVLAAPVVIGNSTGADMPINKVIANDANSSIFSYVENITLDFFVMQKMSLLFQIANLPINIEARDTDFNLIEVGSSSGLTSSDVTVRILDAASGLVLADVPTDMTQDRDWSSLIVEFDPDTRIAVLSGIQDLPGYNSGDGYTVYIPVLPEESTLLYCPGVTGLADVDGACAGGVELNESTPGVSLVTLEGQEYWQVDNVTGNGGFASGLSVEEEPEEEEPPTDDGGDGGGNNSSGSSGSSRKSSSKSDPSHCGRFKPVGTPDLFQIDRNGNTAKLHFTPVSDNVRTYSVIFGYQDGDERFGGISIPVMNENDGVQSLEIRDLDPKASYSFKVVPVNGCASGEWSNWLQAKPSSGIQSIFYRWF
jgi:hypothetical protein